MFDLSGIFGVERFRVWCQKVLPTVYDDSLSYMELLCKVLKVLEEYGKGSAEIAGEVVNLAGELEAYKTTNGENIDAVNARVDGINTMMSSLSEAIVQLRDAVDGKTVYFGEGVDMSDVPADAVIVGGNGTEEEPYNAFEAGGSKANGGWVRVGSEVVPESDFKKLEAVVHDITEVQAGNLKTFAVGEEHTYTLTSDNDGTTDYSNIFNGSIGPEPPADGVYVVTFLDDNVGNYSGILYYTGGNACHCALDTTLDLRMHYDYNILRITSTTGLPVLNPRLQLRRIY